MLIDMGVFKNNGTPKSSILIGFSIIFTIHFGGFTLIFGNTHIPDIEHLGMVSYNMPSSENCVCSTRNFVMPI